MSEIDDLIANIQSGKAPDKPDPVVPGVEVVERHVHVRASDMNRVFCAVSRKAYIENRVYWNLCQLDAEGHWQWAVVGFPSVQISQVAASLPLHDLTSEVAKKCCTEMLVGGNKFLIAYEWFDAERKMRLRHVLKEPFTKG